MNLRAASLGVFLLLLAVPASHANSITFSSDLLGGQVVFSGTGHAWGLHIPITSLSSGSKVEPVTGGKCGNVSCGWLQFTTGNVKSASSTADQFDSGGIMRIVGRVPGGSKDVVLLTATFVGPVDVVETSPYPLGGQLLLSGSIEVDSVDKSVSALFPGITIPSNGTNMTHVLLGIHGAMGSNGSFSGKAQAENLATTPEPSAMLLFGTGLLGMAGVLKRKLSRPS
jgi:PEP-CTERM motif